MHTREETNPIEHAWSKFKQHLRAAKSRTAEALDRAITEALQIITANTPLPGSGTVAMGHRNLSFAFRTWPCLAGWNEEAVMRLQAPALRTLNTN